MTSTPLIFGSQRRRASIGLTPLIDIVFMLLLFFMLATSFERWRTIELDSGNRATEKPLQQKQISLLNVLPERLELNGRPVTIEQIARLFAPRSEGTQWVVKPDGAVDLQRLISVMDSLRTLGIETPIVNID